MTEIQLLTKEYAKLIIKGGINLNKGQCLLIKTQAESYPFARILAETAYKEGSALVRIEIDDLQLLNSRVENQSIGELQMIPDFSKSIEYEMMVKDWAYIRIDNTEDRHYLSGADLDKLSAYKSALTKNSALIQLHRMKSKSPWCVVCVPGERWAKDILGKDATESDLWKVLIPILKLDQKDVVIAWKEHSKTLKERSKKLNDLKIKSLRFISSATDLKVGLLEHSKWVGGGDNLSDGRAFLPNIPTEEVFTTNSRYLVDGYVTTTRAVNVMDSKVENLKLTFKEGKVVDFKADIGQEIIKKFLEIDEGASYVGEIALVDQSSPIARSNLIFNSILYDENASCHLALGAGYPKCLSNANELNSEQMLLEYGCNRSMVHTDFMIGSDDMDIDATTIDEKIVPIMRKGKFVF
ncbi:MAG: aminopeptidase [Sphaerochaetaceae bacterium]